MATCGGRSPTSASVPPPRVDLQGTRGCFREGLDHAGKPPRGALRCGRLPKKGRAYHQQGSPRLPLTECVPNGAYATPSRAGSLPRSVAIWTRSARELRPPTASFVVLKEPRRGQPLSAAGVDQIMEGAKDRAGLAQATCHQCATPASPAFGKRAWPSRPSRPPGWARLHRIHPDLPPPGERLACRGVPASAEAIETQAAAQ